MERVIYNLVKLLAVFLSVSLGLTIAAQFMRSYRHQLEYVGIVVLVAAEIWAFSGQLKWKFRTRTLLILATVEAVILGAWAAMRK